MSLPPSARQLKHTRSITVEVYARDDGLWDVEAHLSDHKTRDFPLATGIRPVGKAVHDMTLRLTIDTSLNVLEAEAHSHAVPYPGTCEAITPDYSRLAGLNLLKGFRQAVRERFGGIHGCTHLSELTAVLPTAAVQAFAGEVFQTRDASQALAEDNTKPFQLDRCHALRSDGAAVREYYPKWYRGAGSASNPE